MSTHVPVMRDEAIAALAPRDGGLYVDGTFGAGGYTRAILQAADCQVLAIDRDPEAIARAQSLVAEFPGRLRIAEGTFGDLADHAAGLGIEAVDGLALDLGLSSPQLDQPERGFSFRAEGPLDMRMARSGPTAADIVNSWPEERLADLIHELGEERGARRVARAIVEVRAQSPITTTGALAALIRRVVRPGNDGIDPATRTFQALRMAVNDELGELVRVLRSAERLLRAGGRLVVVAFHSLEDRIVKDFIRLRGGHGPRPSRHLPDAGPTRAPSLLDLSRKPLRPSEAEIAANPRARSARLRVAERTAAPPWPADVAVGGVG